MAQIRRCHQGRAQALRPSLRAATDAGTLRQPMKALRILILLALLSPSLAVADQKTKPLNFVFILVDDLGWTDLKCFGSSFYDTPNCDRLAASGMKFTNAYAACPVCSPTRASLSLIHISEPTRPY